MIRASFVFLVVSLAAGCGSEAAPGVFANLASDYVLTTSDPAWARVQPLVLRYEDDWLPRACEGATFLSEQDNIILEWRCRYVTGVGTATANGMITGGLSDPDGDGTFTGTIVGYPLQGDNTLATVPVAAEWTLTPVE
jgi:hypothetical protein